MHFLGSVLAVLIGLIVEPNRIFAEAMGGTCAIAQKRGTGVSALDAKMVTKARSAAAGELLGSCFFVWQFV